MAEGKARKAERASCSAAADEGRAAYEAATLHQVANFAALPEGEALHLRFANGQEFVTDGVDVERDHLSVFGGRATYRQACDFPPEGAPIFVKEAVLVAETGEAVFCEVGIGIAAGGGKHALIPAGHLLF
jgi:hypothetical protein